MLLSSDALFRIRRAWSGVAVQELLYKCAIMRPILVSVLLCCSDVAVARAMTLLPCCCHGFLLRFWIVVAFPCCHAASACVIAVGVFCIAVVLFSGCCCRAGALWPVYDLCPCRSSCPLPAAGHWATFTPLTGLLSTLLFLPLDSSIFLSKLSHRSSTLFLLLFLISTWFSLVQENSASVSAFISGFYSTDCIFVLSLLRWVCCVSLNYYLNLSNNNKWTVSCSMFQSQLTSFIHY